MDMIVKLSKEFCLNQQHVGNMIALMDDGNTIPFITQYRKEMTGSRDNQILRELSDRLQYLWNPEKRKRGILEDVAVQGKMTDALSFSVRNTETLVEAKDLYHPYRPKRHTRATIAQEKGLRPLADLTMAQTQRGTTLEKLTTPYANTEKGVESWENVVQEAQNILTEEVSDGVEMRKKLHQTIRRDELVVSRAVQENPVYEIYVEYSEPVSKVPSRRILAIDHGEEEECLKVKLELNDTPALAALCDRPVKPGSVTSVYVEEAAEDSWRHLIFPSLKREIRNGLTRRVVKQAISMFALNLRPLLLQPPVKDKMIMSFDPACRAGYKVAVVDATGKVPNTTMICPTPPYKRTEKAKKELKYLIQKYGVTVILIENGTASKESEIFMVGLLRELEAPISYMVVNEAGASVYSAPKLIATEFPEFDVSLHSAVSITHRLQDPLAELVKVDPRAIGIGRHQYDMPPTELDSALEGVVENCANSMGTDLNTAFVSLLTHISGPSEAVARNVVACRNDNGPFQSRSQLKKVARLGPGAYEQCTGFLRILRGRSTLDSTSVHPESYDAVTKPLKLLGMKSSDLTMQGIGTVPQQIGRIDWKKAVEARGAGIPMLTNIIAELRKPGHDVHGELPPPLLRTDIMNLSDLEAGMELTGTVRNVTDFGAFIDTGIHQDGLVHISQVSDHFIRHPSDLVKVGDVVTVTMLSMEEARKRISLIMKRMETQKAKVQALSYHTFTEKSAVPNKAQRRELKGLD